MCIGDYRGDYIGDYRGSIFSPFIQEPLYIHTVLVICTAWGFVQYWINVQYCGFIQGGEGGLDSSIIIVPP